MTYPRRPCKIRGLRRIGPAYTTKHSGAMTPELLTLFAEACTHLFSSKLNYAVFPSGTNSLQHYRYLLLGPVFPLFLTCSSTPMLDLGNVHQSIIGRTRQSWHILFKSPGRYRFYTRSRGCHFKCVRKFRELKHSCFPAYREYYCGVLQPHCKICVARLF